MKRILILLLTICSFASFGQILQDPNTTPSTGRTNEAISGAYPVSGTDTYTISPAGSFSYTYLTGKAVSVTVPEPQKNTGPSTLNFDGLGDRDIKKWSAGVLVDVDAEDLLGTVRLRYDGTQFVMEGGTGSGGGGSTWGAITGTLSDQTDLQAELDGKAPALLEVNSQSGTSYTFVLGDANKIVAFTNSSPTVVQVPNNATTPFPIGTTILVQRKDGTVTLDPVPPATISTSNLDLDVPCVNCISLLTKTGTNLWDFQNGSPASGTAEWGLINGTLSDQTDLQAALDAKQNDITFGTGAETALGVNVGSAGAFVVNGGSLGTPSSGTATNLTGLPLTTGVTGTLPVANGGTGITSLGTGVATWLGTPSWTNFSSAITGTAPFMATTGTNTLTGTWNITSNVANRQSNTGTWTATADGDTHRQWTSTLTGNATSAHILYGDRFTNSLTAGANNQALYAVSIDPTLSVGGFTNVSAISFAAFGKNTGTNSIAGLFRSGTSTSTTTAATFQDAGALAILNLRGDGLVTMGNGAMTFGFYNSNYVSPGISSNQFLASHNRTPDADGIAFLLGAQAAITSTSGARTLFQMRGNSFSPTSGTATMKFRNIQWTVNQTSTASGNIIIDEVAPTYTSALGGIDNYYYNPTTTSMSSYHTAWNLQAGGVVIDSDLSPAQITANQDNYAPTGISRNYIIRLSTDASRDLTGLVAGRDGEIKYLINVGSFDVVLKDEGGTSTAANRFALSADITLVPDEGCQIWYDGTSDRWRVIQN